MFMLLAVQLDNSTYNLLVTRLLRPDLLNVLLLEPGGSKIFHFRKKINHMIEIMHTHTWLRHRWLICGSAGNLFQAGLCYLGPESLTVPRRKL